MTSDYKLSNEITEVAYSRFRSSEYQKLLDAGESIRKRQKYANNLIQYLCEKYKIEVANVSICNQPQPSRIGKSGRRTLYAYYYFNSKTIKLFNLTAVRQKTVSIKVLTDLLLHEFMHHYDREYLGIKSTPHSQGFKSRISDLKIKLNK